MSDNMLIPGEVIVVPGSIELNAGRTTVELRVINVGDRPIQVGSHFHFAETNPALEFDRSAARGCHLNIAAGTATRFEPGVPQVVVVVPYTGNRFVAGFRGEVAGHLDAASS